MLLSSGDSFPHLIKKSMSKLGFVTYLLNYPRTKALKPDVEMCQLSLALVLFILAFNFPDAERLAV
jgi:hypothetical protein